MKTSRKTKISELDMTTTIQYDVVWLDVTVKLSAATDCYEEILEDK